jgi:hypothetical protein
LQPVSTTEAVDKTPTKNVPPTRRITPPWKTRHGSCNAADSCAINAQFAPAQLGSVGATEFTSGLNLRALQRQFANLNQQCEPGRQNGVGVLRAAWRETMAATKTGGSKRGFAAMDPAKQREIASKGGKASHGGGRKASASR